MAISIVVPLYNKAPWIGRCLDSVAAQTRADYEVVVVDDGSEDGGGDIVRQRGDQRIRLVSQAHAGEGAARNRGLAEARCDRIALLDADDEWLPSFLEVVTRTLDSRADLVAAFTNTLDGSTGAPLLRIAPGDGVLEDYFDFVLRNRGLGMTSSSTIVRREAMLSCGGFREGVPVGADNDAWARLAWSGPVACVEEGLAIYHRGLPGSATTVARNARPLFPVTVRSHAEWDAAGRIPAGLRRSSARLAQHLVLDHVVAMTNYGLRREAWTVLRRHAQPTAGLLGRYLAGHLRLLVPHSILRTLRGAARSNGLPDDPRANAPASARHA